jgi:hypothetical protein
VIAELGAGVAGHNVGDRGVRLLGASMVIGVDGDARIAMAKKMGVDVVLDYRKVDVVSEIRRLTGGVVDVAIEALGTQPTFENALRSSVRAAPLQPRRLLGQAGDPLRRLRRRPGRRPHHHNALPGRQGADAPPVDMVRSAASTSVR